MLKTRERFVSFEDRPTNMDSNQPLVLVVGTGNSCRSQMAEGFLRAVARNCFRVASAGTDPAGFVHPIALAVMEEIGIDISGQRSKSLGEMLGQAVDTVIAVAEGIDLGTQIFSAHSSRHHWPFDELDVVDGSRAEKLAIFRQVRDKMRVVLEAYAAGRTDPGGPGSWGTQGKKTVENG